MNSAALRIVRAADLEICWGPRDAVIIGAGICCCAITFYRLTADEFRRPKALRVAITLDIFLTVLMISILGVMALRNR